MTILFIAQKNIKEIAAKEYFISLMNFFGAAIILGTANGVHCKVTLSIWKWETSFSLHGWDGNIVKLKSQIEE